VKEIEIGWMSADTGKKTSVKVQMAIDSIDFQKSPSSDFIWRARRTFNT